MDRPHSTRRRVLLGCGGALSAALAGCTDAWRTDEAPADDDSDGMNGEDELDQDREGGLGRGDEDDAPDEEEDDRASEVVAVGPDGDPDIEPATAGVAAEQTVRWEWESDDHTVTPAAIPEDADWEGEPEQRQRGHVYEFTFEVPGTYEYYCEPHQDNGMVGEVVVEEAEDGTTEDEDGEETNDADEDEDDGADADEEDEVDADEDEDDGEDGGDGTYAL